MGALPAGYNTPSATLVSPLEAIIVLIRVPLKNSIRVYLNFLYLIGSIKNFKQALPSAGCHCY